MLLTAQSVPQLTAHYRRLVVCFSMRCPDTEYMDEGTVQTGDLSFAGPTENVCDYA